MKTRENCGLDVNYKHEGESDKQKKKFPMFWALFFLIFLFPMVLYTHLPNAKKKGVFLVLLGFIPFNSKPKQIPKPPRWLWKREAWTLKSYSHPNLHSAWYFPGHPLISTGPGRLGASLVLQRGPGRLSVPGGGRQATEPRLLCQACELPRPRQPAESTGRLQVM